MGIFVRPAGSYKFGRRMWVRVAGVWRQVVRVYRRSGSMIINSNYNQGLEVNSFTQHSDLGEAYGVITYNMSAPSSPELESALGLSSLVLKGAFFSNITSTISNSNVRTISCKAWVRGADLFPVPSSVTVTLYNAAGNAMGSATLPLTNNDSLNLTYSLTGAAVTALTSAAHADVQSSPTMRRIAAYF